MSRPKILVVDDEPFNVDFLAQELDDLGYDVVTATNGLEALERVHAQRPDLVLLDIMMPVLDGFAVLERLKANDATRDLPVVVISAVNDLASIVRGIRGGADDWLPKPFEPVLLEARMRSGLDRKLRRDREIDYLRQVEKLTSAADAVRKSTYDEAIVAGVADRDDALGNLARVFRDMANEVVAREQRLRRQLRQLALDVEEQRAGARGSMASFVPIDRRAALASGGELRSSARGTVLFADISGFTPLTESLARELGLQRGAEEITRHVNRVHDRLIDRVHAYGGSAIAFGGDALTCWFDEDDGKRALACAAALQHEMRSFLAVEIPGGGIVSIGLKVAVTRGAVRRFLVGDASMQCYDVLAGALLDRLARAEACAHRDEIVATRGVAMDGIATVSAWRGDDVAVLDVRAAPADDARSMRDVVLDDAVAEPFVPPAIRDKVRAGQTAFLSELRSAASLFLRFSGIDYDADANAAQKIDALTRFVQHDVAAPHDGTLLQLTTGDKGSHFHLTFGAPRAHHDDATRAVRAALAWQQATWRFAFVRDVGAGIAYGSIRAGAYGNAAQRVYSVMGDTVNLAARLMREAAEGTTLCDGEIRRLAQEDVSFEALPPIAVKGKASPVAVFRPLAQSPANAPVNAQMLIDRLSPAEQSTLKLASVIGCEFATPALEALCADEHERSLLRGSLEALAARRVLTRVESVGEPAFEFVDSTIRDAAYECMLFAQRRQLHRALAQWYERHHEADLGPHYATLAHHWQAADEPARAIDYLEKAGERAQRSGALTDAQRFYDESLAIERRAAVLRNTAIE
jgi:CheY-like chemotaxis protein